MENFAILPGVAAHHTDCIRFAEGVVLEADRTDCIHVAGVVVQEAHHMADRNLDSGVLRRERLGAGLKAEHRSLDSLRREPEGIVVVDIDRTARRGSPAGRYIRYMTYAKEFSKAA